MLLGRASSVGIATCFGLDSPKIESSWGEFFRPRPYRPWSLPSLLYKGYRVFPGGKAAGPWPWPPTQSKAEVKERVELYLYSPSGSSWPVLGWTLPLPLPLLRCLQYLFRRSRFTYDKHAVNRAVPVCLSVHQSALQKGDLLGIQRIEMRHKPIGERKQWIAAQENFLSGRETECWHGMDVSRISSENFKICPSHSAISYSTITGLLY
jgi:hypothetical protein